MTNSTRPDTYTIDFGTTNSLLGAVAGDTVLDPIALDSMAADPTVFRSVLFFPNKGACFYGQRAIEAYRADEVSGRLVRSFKKFLPIKSFAGTRLGGKHLTLEEMIAVFLREMRVRANTHFNADVKRVMLGRPARFSMNDDDDQRGQDRLLQAARLAGFEDVDFVAEPVAAAFAFGQSSKQTQILLVADFGGGTSDFTILRMGESSFSSGDVLALGGVAIAGDCYDGEIMRNRISQQFGSLISYQFPMSATILSMPKSLQEKLTSAADICQLRAADTMAFLDAIRRYSLSKDDQRCIDQLVSLVKENLGFSLFEAISLAKQNLTAQDEAVLSFESEEIFLQESLSRRDFEDYIAKDTGKILAALDQTVKDAGLTFDKIDTVCCTGGTAKVPLLMQEITARFGADKVNAFRHHHSVVQGLGEFVCHGR